MSKISRRDSLKILAGAPLASAFTWTQREVQEAQAQVRAAQDSGQIGDSYQPRFFNSHEYETVRVLVDLIIPSDERSMSATQAGVPEFMDFIMTDKPQMQTAMRGGLAWLDGFALRSFDRNFVKCEPAQKREILDAIAYPEKSAPEHSHGVEFFNRFRDLTASGFWTTEAGIEDLQYQGNVFVSEWKGCPPDALQKLGVKYEEE